MTSSLNNEDEIDTPVPLVTVRYWASARRATGRGQDQTRARTVGDLRAQLHARPELAALAAMVSFLVDNQKADDATPLSEGAVVDVLPPFAGGAA